MYVTLPLIHTPSPFFHPFSLAFLHSHYSPLPQLRPPVPLLPLYSHLLEVLSYVIHVLQDHLNLLSEHLSVHLPLHL